MDHKQIEHARVLADALHFGRAAEQLFLSPSALSRSIQRLEDELGEQLFERDNRRVRITAAGQRFLQFAEQNRKAWQDLLDDLGGSGNRLQGSLSLFCSVTAVYGLLSPVLANFRREHPQVDIKLHTGDQAEAVARALAGHEDIAIAAQPHTIPAKLEFQPLLDSPLQLIAPGIPCAISDALEEGGSTQEVWSQLPFILPERGVVRDRVDSWLADLGITPNVYAQVSGNEAIVSMVGLGLGVAVVPGLVRQSSPQRDNLRILEQRIATTPFYIGLACRKSVRNQPLVDAFWKCALTSYADTFPLQ